MPPPTPCTTRPVTTIQSEAETAAITEPPANASSATTSSRRLP
jgi:hypothetical protein